MIYITSDLHLCHDRQFLYEPRGFNSIKEHDLAIVKNWNSVVEWDDDVYVLGDLMLNDDSHGMYLWNQLKGNKHIILGNHDSSIRIENYKKSHNTEVLGYGYPLKYNGYNFFLSHYPTLTSNFDIDKPLKRRTINLCGHVHTKDRFYDWDKGLIYHCELDANNNVPIALNNIIEDIKEKLNA